MRELLQMKLAQRGQGIIPRLGQAQADDAGAVRVLFATDQARTHRPVGQLHGTVVTQMQIRGGLADGWPLRLAMTADRKQQLVLCGCQPGGTCPLLTPPEESTKPGAKREKVGVILVGRGMHHRHLASRPTDEELTVGDEGIAAHDAFTALDPERAHPGGP